ncbi:MAG: hypothetical protein E6J64_13935 [Deltaproteobacteria bacterium]|nr:MAG: hypothetical protein E6J64_13935 [Deltaproteobacteria bacterium]
MTLLALLLALAQQGAQPTTPNQTGVAQPSPNADRPETTTPGNTTEKPEPLSREHRTDLQGEPVKKTRHHKPQARAKAAKPMPEPQTPSGAEEDKSKHQERQGGKGGPPPQQPKPLGEKSDQ